MLFVLYKFTSFFTYMYNFCKFLGQLTQGMFYVKNRVGEFIEHRQNQYISRPSQTTSTTSFFTRMKNKVTNYFWGKSQPMNQELPLYTRVSDIDSFINTNTHKNTNTQDPFDKHLNDLMTKQKHNDDSFISIDLQNSKYDSYYDPLYKSDFYKKRERNESNETYKINESCDESSTSNKNKSDKNESDESVELIKKDIEDNFVEIKDTHVTQDVKKEFNIQDSNMLFNSVFIKNTFNKKF